MKKLVFFILTIFISVGCEKDTFNENFDFLYGDWTPTQINVGMSSPNPSIVGDLIQFIKDDTYTIKKDNKLMESGKIVIEKQTSEELTFRLIAKKVDSSYNPSVKVSGRSLTVINTVSSSLCLSNLATDAGFFGICLLQTN
ncbi:MAG: hypothetical protein ACOXZQ_13915 [Bacteroidales bacterium]|jgi:hypothetical protein